MNVTIISGNIAREVEGRTAASGIETATMTVAVQRGYRNQQGVREADFFRVIVWRQTAEFLERYASKGQKVIVSGRMQFRKYQAQDGSERSVWEMIADEVELIRKNADGDEEKQKAPQADPMGSFEEVDDDELPFEH